MKKYELRNLNKQELTHQLKMDVDELFNLKMRMGITRQVEDNKKFRQLRREIARALTYLNEEKAGRRVIGRVE